MLSETRRTMGQGTWSGLLTQASPPLHPDWFVCAVRNIPTHPIPFLSRPSDLIHHLTRFEPQMQKSFKSDDLHAASLFGGGGALKSCRPVTHRAHSHAVDDVEIYLAVTLQKSCLFLHVTKNAQTQGGAGKIRDASYYLSSTSRSTARTFAFSFFWSVFMLSIDTGGWTLSSKGLL